MRNLVILCVLMLGCFANVSLGQMVPEQATFDVADHSSPALASSADGLTMLAYNIVSEPIMMTFVGVQAFPTEWTDGQIWSEPSFFTAGYSPVICYSRSGFHLAFASGSMVMLYHSDLQGNWDHDNFTMLEASGQVAGIDLWGLASVGVGPDVYMTVEVLTGETQTEHDVLFAYSTDNTWSEFEAAGYEDEMFNARITGYPQYESSIPIVFYMHEEDGARYLKSVSSMGASGWTPAAYVTDSPIYNEYDVALHGFLNIDIIGLGEQPTCPCGSVHYQAYTQSSGWQPAENLTAHYATYDWPHAPCIAIDPEVRDDQKVHAFWYQEASAPDMTPYRKTLEYRVLENGVWTNAGAFLNASDRSDTFGPKVALAVDPSPYPVLAYTRTDTVAGEEAVPQIWIARHASLSAVAEETPSQPQLHMSAFPNPFNPMVTISFRSEHAQSAQLNIFDARGLHIATLFDGMVSPGQTQVQWHGKDTSGRSQSSGIYFARLVTDSGNSVLKLVLSE